MPCICHLSGGYDPWLVTAGDVILRALVDGKFQVFDALTERQLTGPLTLLDALAFAETYGATTAYEQPVDASGRVLSAPRHFLTFKR